MINVRKIKIELKCQKDFLIQIFEITSSFEIFRDKFQQIKTFRKILLAGEPFKNFHEYRIYKIDFLGSPHTALETIDAVVCCISVDFILSEISQDIQWSSIFRTVAHSSRSVTLSERKKRENICDQIFQSHAELVVWDLDRIGQCKLFWTVM